VYVRTIMLGIFAKISIHEVLRLSQKFSLPHFNLLISKSLYDPHIHIRINLELSQNQNGHELKIGIKDRLHGLNPQH